MHPVHFLYPVKEISIERTVLKGIKKEQIYFLFFFGNDEGFCFLYRVTFLVKIFCSTKSQNDMKYNAIPFAFQPSIMIVCSLMKVFFFIAYWDFDRYSLHCHKMLNHTLNKIVKKNHHERII